MRDRQVKTGRYDKDVQLLNREGEKNRAIEEEGAKKRTARWGKRNKADRKYPLRQTCHTPVSLTHREGISSSLFFLCIYSSFFILSLHLFSFSADSMQQ